MSARDEPPPQRLNPGAAAVAHVFGRTLETLLVPWHIAQRAAVVHGYDLFPNAREK